MYYRDQVPWTTHHRIAELAGPTGPWDYTSITTHIGVKAVLQQQNH